MFAMKVVSNLNVEKIYTLQAPMDWLNYHHFMYFWTVVREGGLVPAAKALRLAHPTVSGQIKHLVAGKR